MSTLLVDIGNTRVKWRLVDVRTDGADGSDAFPDALAVIDVAHIASRWNAFAHRRVDAAWISNVADARVDASVVDAIAGCWPAARIEHVVPAALDDDLINGYDEPARLGPDRWLAMIGARALVPRRSLLVCTFGTATTVDLVTVASSGSRQATFVGGLILPGFDAMRRSLAAETARLPDAAGSVLPFATNTADCIASGIVAAQWGTVEQAIARAPSRADLEPLTCLFAGGAVNRVASLIGGLVTPHRVVTDLTLRGLAIVASRKAYRDREPVSLATVEPLA